MIQSQKAVTVENLVETIADKLCEKYCNEFLCKQYAWWVLEAVTQTKQCALLLEKNILLTEEQTDMLNTWITQQVNEHIPLQYLIGTVPFAECELIVEPPVPLPRAETEEWVTRFIAQLKKNTCEPKQILDLGTGSGCIAITLAKAFPNSTIYASDISPQALALAQKNAIHNHVSIQYLQGDLFEALNGLKFDIIISNPPYISPEEWKCVDPSVRNWEDSNAHVACDNGINILQQIIAQAPDYLMHNQLLQDAGLPNVVVEIGYNQGAIVQKLFLDKNYEHILIQQDLYGNDRIVSGYSNVPEKDR